MSDEDKKFTQADIDAAAASIKARYDKKLEAAEAKTSELSKKLSDYDSRFEALEDKEKTELEKLQKQNEKLMKQIEDKDAAVKASEEKAQKVERDNGIEKLFSSVKLVDGLDKDMVRGAFANQFKDLSIEDLGNKAATDGIIKAFSDSNKALIVDDSGGGLGSSKSSASGGVDKVNLPKSFKGMTHEDAVKQLDSAWAASTAMQED